MISFLWFIQLQCRYWLFLLEYSWWSKPESISSFTSCLPVFIHNIQNCFWWPWQIWGRHATCALVNNTFELFHSAAVTITWTYHAFLHQIENPEQLSQQFWFNFGARQGFLNQQKRVLRLENSNSRNTSNCNTRIISKCTFRFRFFGIITTSAALYHQGQEVCMQNSQINTMS